MATATLSSSSSSVSSSSKKGAKGSRKLGRGKKKAEGKTRPLSLFVRGKISAHKYWELTGQSLKVSKQAA